MTAEPVPASPPPRPHKVSTIAVHPRRAEIEADILAGHGVRVTAEKYGCSVPALFPYARKLRLRGESPANPQSPRTATLGPLPSVSVTVARAQALMREAVRHMKDARSSGDLKAANGAISSATKAIELYGKATKEISSGPDISLTLTQVQQTAVGLHEQASHAPIRDVIVEAGNVLRAQLGALDPEAVRIVRELGAVLAQAEVSAPSRTVHEEAPSAATT